jgi:hypothetical protein
MPVRYRRVLRFRLQSAENCGYVRAMNPDDLIERINAWLTATRTSVKEAADRAKVAQNTAHLALKGRGGRIETLRRLCALVPDDFHAPSSISDAEEAERSNGCHTNLHSASENCDVGAQ